MQKIVKYTTADGKEFNTEGEAKNHERKVVFIGKLTEFIHNNVDPRHGMGLVTEHGESLSPEQWEAFWEAVADNPKAFQEVLDSIKPARRGRKPGSKRKSGAAVTQGTAAPLPTDERPAAPEPPQPKPSLADSKLGAVSSELGRAPEPVIPGAPR